jgi:hypothetical protein
MLDPGGIASKTTTLAAGRSRTSTRGTHKPQQCTGADISHKYPCEIWTGTTPAGDGHQTACKLARTRRTRQSRNQQLYAPVTSMQIGALALNPNSITRTIEKTRDKAHKQHTPATVFPEGGARGGNVHERQLDAHLELNGLQQYLFFRAKLHLVRSERLSTPGGRVGALATQSQDRRTEPRSLA